MRSLLAFRLDHQRFMRARPVLNSARDKFVPRAPTSVAFTNRRGWAVSGNQASLSALEYNEQEDMEKS